MRGRVRYRTIVADPPWEVMGGPPWGGGASKPLPYPTMTVDAIASLPVRELAESAAHLYLWTINAYLEDTYEIARLWGFRPSTLLTWTKPITGGGLGGCYRLSTEWCLFARRGILTAKTQVGQSHFDWPRQGRHSQKPDAFMDMVEAVSPGPYLEMFSRRARLSWDTWGNEALGHVEIGGAA
jgi:N6-adenosine-specific RNA methylase IME4